MPRSSCPFDVTMFIPAFLGVGHAGLVHPPVWHGRWFDVSVTEVARGGAVCDAATASSEEVDTVDDASEADAGALATILLSGRTIALGTLCLRFRFNALCLGFIEL